MSLRLFRTAAGKKTAVAFSSPLALAKVLGAGHGWIRISEPALRRMLADLDVTGIVLDPAGTLPARTPARAPERRPAVRRVRAA
ncbi:hypothetical protein Skr01_56780 [Sphaerisporangium krabiense]|nr:hypothetical protein Skr01_56780 [Sphaerisporangium krabiense]